MAQINDLLVVGNSNLLGSVNAFGDITAPTFIGKLAWGNVTGKPATVVSWNNREVSVTAAGSKAAASIPVNLTGFNRISFTTTDNGTSPTAQSIVLNGVNDDTSTAKAPGIGFHIGNKSWGSLKFLSDGTFRFYNASCDGYMSVYATTFYGKVNTTNKNITTRMYPTWVNGDGGARDLYTNEMFSVWRSSTAAYLTLGNSSNLGGITLHKGNGGYVDFKVTVSDTSNKVNNPNKNIIKKGK